ncbi:hypothetical protein RhiLY_03755 [Ceratobasidium sp. AG-Ba]|nr:hypothetical protein RhiLY_03755 [Ceratobasidium sp. AG-Ba]
MRYSLLSSLVLWVFGVVGVPVNEWAKLQARQDQIVADIPPLKCDIVFHINPTNFHNRDIYIECHQWHSSACKFGTTPTPTRTSVSSSSSFVISSTISTSTTIPPVSLTTSTTSLSLSSPSLSQSSSPPLPPPKPKKDDDRERNERPPFGKGLDGKGPPGRKNDDNKKDDGSGNKAPDQKGPGRGGGGRPDGSKKNEGDNKNQDKRPRLLATLTEGSKSGLNGTFISGLNDFWTDALALEVRW